MNALSPTPIRARRHRRLTSTRDWSQPITGLMLRRPWVQPLLARAHTVDLTWLELYPENHLWHGAADRLLIQRLAQWWPITCHGVHLSLGSPGPLNRTYLDPVKAFLDDIDAVWFSEHIGVSVLEGQLLHEILPVPFDEAHMTHIATRADEAAAHLQRPFLLENTAWYCPVPGSTMTEAEFYAGLFERCDIGVLLDVNNLYVNAINHGYDPRAWLDQIPLDRVVEIHIGGFTRDKSGLLIDSHGAAPVDAVWSLLTDTLERTGPKPVLLEWEDNAPDLDGVLRTLGRVKRAWYQAAEAVA